MNQHAEKHADVTIIGGGPAGSTAAIALLKSGLSVRVMEKDKFPRFHIGESLLPFSMAALERLGLTEKLAAAGFMQKHGAEITSGCGESETRFYFKDGFRSSRATALQVPRAEFDKLLLDHARECGAEVHEETRVTGVELRPGGTTIHARNAAGGAFSVESEYLIDCSGRHSIIGRKLNLKRDYPGLRKFAVYAHFENLRQPEGIDGTLTRMIRERDRWFWIIPLTRTRASVGVVMDTDLFKGSGLSPGDMLEKSIRRQPLMQERLCGGERVTEVYSSGDYSYRNTRFTGERWLLAGDAAGFIDPIFSSGVFLAILSGEKAADAIVSATRNPATRGVAFRRYERHLNRVMDLYLKFVESWYRTEFIETLLNPTEFFRVVPAVNAVLAGNLGRSLSLKWRLALFHGIVALQRLLPISPKLSLAPKTAMKTS